MEYLSDEQLFQYFQKEINESKQKRINKLRKEIDGIKEKELKIIHQELDENIQHALRLELKELRTNHSFEINKINTENSRNLMKKRQELLQLVFDEVSQKLKKYLKSKEYEAKMKEKILGLENTFQHQEVQFQIGDNDTILENVIKSVYQGKNKIEKVDSIMHGGFIVSCLDKGIEIDETIDNRLLEKKEWFYENSNLFIK